MKISITSTKKINLQPWDYFALLYLALPVLFFFAMYTITAVAIPVSIFIVYCISRLRISNNSEGIGKAALILNAIVAATIVITSGAAGPLYVNSDWYKHYAIFNQLAGHSTIAEQAFTLRYYIGAYIFPAQAERVLGFSNGVIFASWLSVGLFVFLNQLSSLINNKFVRWAAPILFMSFSGADIIGNHLTGFQWGPMYHLEWWSGWIQYSSTITSMFWAPQSTLPAWISIAMLSRRTAIDEKLFIYPIILACCLLWSPFVALGITPFMLLLIIGDPEFKKCELKIPFLAGIAVIGGLLSYYLTFDVAQIPKHWIWNNPCVIGPAPVPCFTLSAYAIFIILEVIPAWTISAFSKSSNKPILHMSIAILVLIPFAQVGLASDLSMSASKPAIAALAIALISSLQDKGVLRLLLIALVFAAGLATPAGEMMRSFSFPRDFTSDKDLSNFVEKAPEYSEQYVTKKNIAFLRQE